MESGFMGMFPCYFLDAFRATCYDHILTKTSCESERNGLTSSANQVNHKLTNTIYSTLQSSFTIRAVSDELKR
jgi:hypothetical protein